MLLDDIKIDIQTSLKQGDTVRLSTLRMILSGIRYAAIAKYGAQGETSITDQDVLDVIKKQAKERRESIESFVAAGRTDLSDKEQAELAILTTFLPKELSDEELRLLLEPLKTSGETNFGLLMKQAVVLVAGRADGSRVSTMVKQLLAP